MKRTPALRALSFLGSTLLVLSVFGACSNDDDSSSTVAGPPSISITKLSFGPATVAADGAPACGNPLAVTLSIINWQMKEPGLCESTPQCGQVRVTLLKSSGSTALAPQVAVSGAIELNLATALEAGSYTIEAALINDAGTVFAITDAGSSSAQKSFTLNPPVDCSMGAGAVGSSSSEAGASGFGGAPSGLGTAGTAGTDGFLAGSGGSGS